jgi:hypothetical protein
MVNLKLLGLFLFLTIVGDFSLIAQSNKMSKENGPRMVLIISVDQMRTDYLSRYWNKFQAGGFKRLVDEGTLCSNARLDLHVQKFSTGTATLFTGVYPSINGIVNDNWYDRLKKKEVNCIADDYYITVGSDSKEGERSPKKLLSPTIGDLIKLNTNNKAKVFSVAMNDVSAVLSAGHAADGAYWFDNQNGNMISSSFYIDIFPEWVRQFNEKAIPKAFAQREWTTLLPITSYEESHADDYILEKGFADKWNTFPYSMKKLKESAGSFKFLKTTPYGNNLLRDFAINLMIAEKLGKDEYPDLLNITFSSMDYENNSFGPGSVEMEDIYLRMDQDISLILDYMDKAIGKGNSVVVLTSACSSMYPAEYLKEEFHMPVGNISPENMVALLKSYLNITFGQGDWIEVIGDQQLYFNLEFIEKKSVSLEEIEEKTASFINQFEGIKIALPASSFAQGDYTKGQLAVIANSYNFKRSGDVLYTLEDGWQPVYKFQKTMYNDNSNVPLIFHGYGVKNTRVRTEVNLIQLFPTIMEILNMSIPDHCSGDLIEEVLK